MKRSEGPLLVERFWSRVAKGAAHECWVWTGAQFNGGYGRFKAAGRDTVAHRWSYEMVNGPVPNGLQLDHLCRNRLCVNPAHLEAVTARTNVLRGETITAANIAKTHCAKGHPFSGTNLIIARNGTKRLCRICKNEYSRQFAKTDVRRRNHAHYERNRRKTMKAFMARQGDVMIKKVTEIPSGAKDVTPQGRIILALGEQTGHSHAIAEGEAREFSFADAGNAVRRFLSVVSLATVKHEEHAPIPLTPGAYEIIQQREYSREEIRNVAD
jgi:hypothetical protein